MPMAPLKAALPLYVSANTQRDKVAGALANRVRSKSQAQVGHTTFSDEGRFGTTKTEKKVELST